MATREDFCSFEALEGHCAPLSALSGVSTGDLAEAIASASDLIWALTGRQFGAYTETVRPDLRSVSSSSFDLRRFPVSGIVEVKVDGVVLDPTEYWVSDGHVLNRTDGTSWPATQKLYLDDTEEETFSVTLTWGGEPPIGVQQATRRLACELLSLKFGGQSGLPDRVRSTVRQGISMEHVSAEDLLNNGRTGIFEIDLVLSTYNRDETAALPAVMSPDIGWYDHDGTTTVGVAHAAVKEVAPLVVAFMHIGNLNIGAAHPFGAYLSPGSLIELVGQTTSSENGTYVLGANPATDLMTLADDQIIDIANLGKLVTVSTVAQGAYVWGPIAGVIITGDGVNAKLSQTAGTTMYVQKVIDLDGGTLGTVDLDGAVAAGSLVLVVNSSGGTGEGIWRFVADGSALAEIDYIASTGVAVYDMSSDDTWLLTPHTGWMPFKPDPTGDSIDRAFGHALMREWDLSTDAVLRSHPSTAPPDGTNDGAWEITNAGTDTGTLPATPDGIDVRMFGLFPVPYRDDELAVGEAWPHQQFREWFTQTRAAATGGDTTEFALLHASLPDWPDDFPAAVVHFGESTVTGGAGEGEGLQAADPYGPLIGVPVYLRATIDCANETMTLWRGLPFDAGITGAETVDGIYWVPVGSRTGSQYASMRDDGALSETYKLGVNNQVLYRWIRANEFGDPTLILDIDAADLNAAVGDTSFTDGAGNTISTTDGVIEAPSSGGTPDDGSVTNAKVATGAAIDLSKLQTISTARLLGRSTSGTGAIEQLTAAQVLALIGDPWVTILDSTLGSATASFTVDTTGYNFLEVMLTGLGDNSTATVGMRVRFNVDSGSNYLSNTAAATTAWNSVGSMPGSLTNTDRSGLWAATIDLGHTAHDTVCHYRNSYRASEATVGTAGGQGAAYYTNTAAAITSMLVYPSAGNWAAGTRMFVRARV
jgi:hypothetical protein